MRIIEKYRSERQSDKVFNLYSRKHLIILTRKLGQAYGFDMTFHVARHNFGTHITLSMGVPIETVSRMMGHKSITTTQIYAKVTDKKVGEDMKGLKTRTKGRKIVLCEEDVSVMKKKRAQSDKEKSSVRLTEKKNIRIIIQLISKQYGNDRRKSDRNDNDRVQYRNRNPRC